MPRRSYYNSLSDLKVIVIVQDKLRIFTEIVLSCLCETGLSYDDVEEAEIQV